MGYRQDQLVQLIKGLDQRSGDEEQQLLDENTIDDRFYPLAEKLTLSDTVTVTYYTPASQVWGGVTALVATAFAFNEWANLTRVTIH